MLAMRKGKAQGYGADSVKYLDPLVRKMKVIVYRRGPYLVIDRYTGQEQNVGETITLYRGQPIYGFNYYGRMLVERPRAEETYEFLKAALRAGNGKVEHRGPKTFKKDDYVYHNRYVNRQGILEGRETIYFKRKLIYIQVYHGGMIEDRRSYAEWAKRLLSINKLNQALK